MPGGAVAAKHGSGCVLSAAITANLALGDPLVRACGKAKAYTYQFLKSNSSLLGLHQT
ncbi:bifunctional hydroxymethylpyrimidine kinase/phosphomethylpyrimidine kinase [Chitinophaga horti]|uniref:bifunctional hydroxymethylpyrimidine kinase/phosphomethylpyrimidine kinase n=1 Tax=Chitinophaga horti TaxID=2920382 RepID=UPI003D814208